MYKGWYEGASLMARTVKNLPAVQGDPGSNPGSGRAPGRGSSKPLQYSCLGNPMDRGDWWAEVHEVPKSQTQLSQYTHIYFLALSVEQAWRQ